MRWALLLFATAVSFLIALLCIRRFLKFLQRHGLWPFVAYRVGLGVVLLGVFL